MSNSSLVSYTKLSPNRTAPRNHKIDTVTIHIVVGQLTAKEILNLSHFTTYNANSGASCNYAVGCDGSIGLCVEEENRSWCSSSRDNDHRAITIEVASDKTEPYAITQKAYDALIKLLADICKRNGIKELKWKADKSLIGQVDKQNMTVHRWFANKACPGEYLYSRHAQIASEVNDILNPPKATTPTGLVAGAKYALKDVPVYGSESGSSLGTRSGTYYIWSTEVKNGRIRMTNRLDRVGKAGQVSFFVDVASLGVVVPNTKAGTKYVLDKTPVYGSESGKSLGIRSGTYYVWSDKVSNNRIRMTNSPSRVGVKGQVSFFVDIKDLK